MNPTKRKQQRRGFVEFSLLHIKVVRPYLKRAENRDMASMKAVGHRASRSEKERALLRLWSAYIEIALAFPALQDVVGYLRCPPRGSLGIPRSRFFRYHLTGYYNQVYILHTRLVAYRNIVLKLYSSNPLVVDGRLSKATGYILGLLKRIDKVRGEHVHERQYDDDDLSHLTTLEIFLEYDAACAREAAMTAIYPMSVRKVKKKLLTHVGGWNKIIEELLDIYCDVLRPIVFDERGRWIPPDKLRAEKRRRRAS